MGDTYSQVAWMAFRPIPATSDAPSLYSFFLSPLLIPLFIVGIIHTTMLGRYH